MDDKTAEQRGVFSQRDTESSAGPGKIDMGTSMRVASFRGTLVRGHIRMVVERCPLKKARRPGARIEGHPSAGKVFGKGLGQSKTGSHLEAFAIVSQHHAKSRLAQVQRLFQYRVE